MRISPCSTFSGQRRAASPRISPTLKMLLPTTFPTARAALPRAAASRLTTSSGAEVPKATTVRPMITGRMRRARARLEAPLTNPSAPK